MWTRLVSWIRCYVRRRRKLKSILLVSEIFPGKADSVILLGSEYTIKPQDLMKIVWAIFEKIETFIFLMLTTLNFKGKLDRKWEKRARDICKGTLHIECERDWSVGLGAMLSDV